MEKFDLTALPLDVLAIVASKLGGEDLARLQSSCRTFADRAGLEQTWKALFQKEYGSDDTLRAQHPSSPTSWKDRFAKRRWADKNRAAMRFSLTERNIQLGSEDATLHVCKMIGNDLIAGIRPLRRQLASSFTMQVWSLKEGQVVHSIDTAWSSASQIRDIDNLGSCLAVVQENGQVGAWEIPNLGSSSTKAQLGASLSFMVDMKSYLPAESARYISRKVWTSVAVIRPQEQMEKGISVLVSAILPHSHSIMHLLSGNGELLSQFSVPTFETCLSHSRTFLMYRNHPATEYKIVRVGTWEVVGEDTSDMRFRAAMEKLVAREGGCVTDLAIAGRYLHSDTLVRCGSYRRSDVNHGRKRGEVVWGGKIRCFAEDHGEEGIWHFMVPPGESCKDVTVHVDGVALILTCEEDTVRQRPSSFKVWKAQSNQLVGKLDVGLQTAKAQNSPDLDILGHLHQCKARFLRGTGRSIVVSLEFPYNNISRKACKAVAFWTVASGELSILPLDRCRSPLGDWRWVVSQSCIISNEGPKIHIYDFGGVK